MGLEPTDRQAIVILGMHRSGTSAVAGTFARMGFAGPRTPLPASADNPGGFYESAVVVDANFRLMLAAGTAWNLCLTLDPGNLPAFGHPTPAEIVAWEFGDRAPFVLKDPRLCLTLPAWLPALETNGATPRFIITLRHPAEVVRSLASRNGLPEHETVPHWLHHMLEAEYVTRCRPRAVILYDDLMAGWRPVLAEAGRVAAIDWPRQFADAAPDIDRFLSAAARHHAVQDGSAAIGPQGVRDMVDAAWTALRLLSDNPGSSQTLEWLDAIRARFAIWRRAACPPGFRVHIPGFT